MSGKGRLAMDSETNDPKMTLEELAIDVSAFLHFLSEHYDGERNADLPSFWMLIPKSLDVEWRPGTSGFYLEKEVFSRKIWIIAQPVSETERERRRAELLMMFQSSIAEDQAKQIILLLSRIHDESRKAMIENFKKYISDRDRRPNDGL